MGGGGVPGLWGELHAKAGCQGPVTLLDGQACLCLEDSRQ